MNAEPAKQPRKSKPKILNKTVDVDGTLPPTSKQKIKKPKPTPLSRGKKLKVSIPKDHKLYSGRPQVELITQLKLYLEFPILTFQYNIHLILGPSPHKYRTRQKY